MSIKQPFFLLQALSCADILIETSFGGHKSSTAPCEVDEDSAACEAINSAGETAFALCVKSDTSMAPSAAVAAAALISAIALL